MSDLPDQVWVHVGDLAHMSARFDDPDFVRYVLAPEKPGSAMGYIAIRMCEHCDRPLYTRIIEDANDPIGRWVHQHNDNIDCDYGWPNVPAKTPA